MFSLIIGGAASGKSEEAERLSVSLPGERIYLATMPPWDEECRERIVRHQRRRAALGFRTIEKYTGLEDLAIGRKANVLLECLGNLLANELYSPEGGGTKAVLSGVGHIRRSALHLTIVTNEVFSGGADYGEDTIRYMKALAKINRLLAQEADLVCEMVCGRRNVLKGGRIVSCG